MSAKSDVKLSAYFPGLIDVCAGENGQCVYLIANNGEFILEESAQTDKGEVLPPDKEHFPFLLPRAEKVMDYISQDDPNLYQDIYTFLKRFSALDELQWSIVAHYVFLTFMHDHQDIDYCPILLFYAVPERGKSRTGKSLSHLAYRGIPVSELREANIFRYSQDQHGTLFFDLMDVWKKATQKGCEDILLGRFEKGQKCSRVQHLDKGPFRDMEYYDIYGPTIIATNEQLHKILDTRCLSITMPNLPGNYENPRPILALDLKERLTAWRAKTIAAELPDMQPLKDISGRLWDITKPLFQVGLLVNPAGHDLLKESILAIAGERGESKKDSIEGRLIGVIKDISAERNLEGLEAWGIMTSDILKKFNEDRPTDKHYTPQWIGKKLQSMSLRHRTIKGRSEILLSFDEYWRLVEQYGCSGRDLDSSRSIPTQTLPDKTQSLQDDAGVVGSGRVSEHAQATFNNPEELESDEMDRLSFESGTVEDSHELPF